MDQDRKQEYTLNQIERWENEGGSCGVMCPPAKAAHADNLRNHLSGSPLADVVKTFDSVPKKLLTSSATTKDRYRWPGNIREMRNVIERSITLARGKTIEVSDLPEPLRNRATDRSEDSGLDEISRDEALDRADRAYLTKLLEKHGGVIASAARQAGLSRQGMNKLLKRHGINTDDFPK